MRLPVYTGEGGSLQHRSIVAAVALLAVFASPAARAQSLPAIGGDLPGPLPIFPASNWWNLSITGAPVDAQSSTFISFVGGAGRALHADMGGSADGDPIESYGIPYVRVNASQSKLAVTFDYSDDSDGVDHNTDTSFPFYPIPSQAITEPHWIEGGWAGNDPNAGGDRHMLIVDVDNKHLYELFDLRWVGSQWAAGSGAFWDMNVNGRRPDTWTSADAAGLAILPGLIRYEEVFSGQPIQHAFRMTVQGSPNYFVYPASHKACTACPSNAPPMGARFRLKPGVSIPGAAHIQRIVQAMKTYGLLVADNGSNMFITGTYDTRWDGASLTSPGDTVIDEINGAFGQLHASDFEVVKLGYRAWDLAAGVTDSPDPVNVGSNITYVASVTNLDHATAPGVVLTDTLPGGTSFVSASGCTHNAGVVTCAIGTLAAGATVNRTILVTATAGGTLTNTVTVSHTDPSFGSQDSVPANNTATTSTTSQQAVVSIGDANALEGSTGPNAFAFVVTRSGSTTQTVTVPYSTADGTATAGSDYTAASSSVVFAPGETSKLASITVAGDTTVEPDETFVVNLGVPTNATVSDGQGLGTIRNDDAEVSIGDASALEGHTGPNAMTFVVTRSGSTTQTATVPYSTADGSATAGSDYTAASSSVVFAPGETSQLVSITVAGDLAIEPDETFVVNLGTPTNATVSDGQGLGTILNDDPPGVSSLADFVMLGEVRPTTVSNIVTTRWFKVRLAPGRSYAASVWAPGTDPLESAVVLDLAWFLDDGVTAALGVDSTAREPVPDTVAHDGDGESIIPTAAQCAVPTGCSYRLRLQATGATTDIPARLMIVETTLVSPYWQVVTGAGYDAAPQIRNNTSSSVPVTITFFGSAGAVVCSNTFTLEAGAMSTFGISGGAPGCGISIGFGSAQIAFHGPPGSVTGNITSFSSVSGLSFDAPFKPRNTWTIRSAN